MFYTNRTIEISKGNPASLYQDNLEEIINKVPGHSLNVLWKTANSSSLRL